MSKGTNENDRPEPEVSEKPVRRQFTAEYKLKILAEAERCTEPGQLGQLLRREGLYSSHLANWRRLREQGSLSSLAPKQRGRKPKPDDEAAQELERLRRENQRLSERKLRGLLERAEGGDRPSFDIIVFEIASAPNENIELIRVVETVEAPKVDGEPTA